MNNVYNYRMTKCASTLLKGLGYIVVRTLSSTIPIRMLTAKCDMKLALPRIILFVSTKYSEAGRARHIP